MICCVMDGEYKRPLAVNLKSPQWFPMRFLTIYPMLSHKQNVLTAYLNENISSFHCMHRTYTTCMTELRNSPQGYKWKSFLVELHLQNWIWYINRSLSKFWITSSADVYSISVQIPTYDANHYNSNEGIRIASRWENGSLANENTVMV